MPARKLPNYWTPEQVRQVLAVRPAAVAGPLDTYLVLAPDTLGTSARFCNR